MVGTDFSQWYSAVILKCDSDSQLALLNHTRCLWDDSSQRELILHK